jgi:hypothetical protein
MLLRILILLPIVWIVAAAPPAAGPTGPPVCLLGVQSSPINGNGVGGSCDATSQDPSGPAAAARLNCPPSGQPIDQKSLDLTWSPGNQIQDYRVLIGGSVGSAEDGDTSLMRAATQTQLSGYPGGSTLYITLWSYDKNGNLVQPPSICTIKTAQEQTLVAFNDEPQTTFTGSTLQAFPVDSGPVVSGMSAPGVVGLPAVVLPAGARVCESQCKLNAACQGYTYYPPGTANPRAMCDLKNRITQTQQNACCISALKTVSRSAPAVAPPVRPGPPVSPTPPAQPVQPVTQVTGEWMNQIGGLTRLVQQGNLIGGTYSVPNQPYLAGNLQGTFDGRSLRATLTWRNGLQAGYGTLLLSLTPQGRLEGTWTDSSGATGPWSMGRPALADYLGLR